MAFYWIPDEDHAFIPARVEREGGSEWEFSSKGFDGIPEKKVIIKAADVKALREGYEDQLRGVDDITTLPAICEGSLLHTIRQRYHRQEIYTNVAKILIAVNPFQNLPITGDDYVQKYRNGHPSDLPPHVYGISRAAYDGICTDRTPQAVLVAGESGAGKTETAKLIFKWISEVAGDSSSAGGIESRILDANPILEAFGNAKTVKNNNSSRFGKWVEIAMTDGKKIHSANITDYLLEQTRVIQHGAAERNYHIFFQLLAGRPDVGKAEDFKILSYGSSQITGVDDLREWNDTIRSFKAMSVSDNEVEDVMTMVKSVLYLGNVEFLDTESSDGMLQVKDLAPVQKVADLLGLESAALRQVLCCEMIQIGNRGSFTIKALSAEQAQSRKGALIKLLYSKMFSWLVQRLNDSLSVASAPVDHFIGVLDIAGFECFQTNLLEQLFINLSNEKLQQFFNSQVFKQELEEYTAEGISIEDFVYQDNEHILQLIEGKDGLLSALDEEIKVPKATDLTYQAKISKKFASNTNFIPPRFGGAKDPTFTIKHYAGNVSYTVTGFLEKNLDKVSASTLSLLMNAKLDLMQAIGKSITAETEAASSNRKKQKTVSSSFKASLGDLITKLRKTTPHFVRCIKPNAEKVSNKFTGPMCIEQLLYSGVMEAVHIRARGFPLKMPFEDFCKRYFLAVPYKDRARHKMTLAKVTKDNVATSMSTVLKALGEEAKRQNLVWNDKMVVMGKTRVFAKSEMQNTLTALHRISQNESAIAIQNRMRCFLARCKVAKRKAIMSKANRLYEDVRKGSAGSHYNQVNRDLKKMEHNLEVTQQSVEEWTKVFQHHRFQQLKSEADSMKAEVTQLKAAFAVDLNKCDLQEMEQILLGAAQLNLDDPVFVSMQTTLDLSEQIKNAIATKDVQWLESNLNGEKGEEITRIINCSSDKGKKEEIAAILGESSNPRIQSAANDWALNKVVTVSEKPVFTPAPAAQDSSAPAAQNSTASSGGSKKEPKSSKQSKKSGKKKMGVDRMVRKFDAAAKDCDFEVFESLIEGYGTDYPEVEKYVALYSKLQDRDFVLEAFNIAVSNSMANPTNDRPIVQMRNLLEIAKKLDMQEVLCQHYRMVECVDHQSRDAKCTDFVNVLSEKYDFVNFPELKDWCRGTTFAKQEHLLDSFTSLKDEAHQQEALETFKTIQSIVGREAEEDVSALVKDVVLSALMDRSFCNEIYFQVMNQMTANDSSDEMENAWDLLEELVQTVAPTTDARYYFLGFLKKNQINDQQRYLQILKMFQETVSGQPRKTMYFDPRGKPLKRDPRTPTQEIMDSQEAPHGSDSSTIADDAAAVAISVSEALKNNMAKLQLADCIDEDTRQEIMTQEIALRKSFVSGSGRLSAVSESTRGSTSDDEGARERKEKKRSERNGRTEFFGNLFSCVYR